MDTRLGCGAPQHRSVSTWSPAGLTVRFPAGTSDGRGTAVGPSAAIGCTGYRPMLWTRLINNYCRDQKVVQTSQTLQIRLLDIGARYARVCSPPLAVEVAARQQHAPQPPRCRPRRARRRLVRILAQIPDDAAGAGR